MKQFIIACLLIIGYVIQSLLSVTLANAGIRVDILLAVCVSLAIMNGPLTGAAVGFFSGIIVDLVYGMHPGIGIIQYTLVCAAAGFFKGIHYMGVWLKPAGIAALAFLVKDIIMLLAQSFMQYDLSSAAPLLRILSGALATGFIMIPVHIGLRRVQRLRFMRRPDDDRIFMN